MTAEPSATRSRYIGPYRIETRLGRGGMGEVFKAWDPRLERWVAIKHRHNTTDNASRARFLREARSVAALDHPAIIQVFDILQQEDDDWIVMELIDGPSLAELISDGPLDVALALDYGQQIAEGLAAAHAAGILHRDLKASNVMLAPATGDIPGRIKILDFGLAKVLPIDDQALTHTAGDPPDLTLPGKVMGTPKAMSPEQALDLELDERSDLFALGILLYELLTTRSPFRAKDARITLARIATHRQPPARQFDPRIPVELSHLVDQLLEKEAANRPPNALTVADILAQLRQADSPHVVATALPTDALSELPTDVAVVKTLVDCHLAGTTQLLELHSDRDAADLLGQHDRLARDLLARHRGFEIDRAGGFLLLFDSPAPAVDFVLDYHQALHDFRQRHGVELAGQVGIHVGEVILRRNSAGDIARGAKPLELSGLARPTAARLRSLACHGQTLLTHTAHEVARRGALSPRANVRWLDHGRYRLHAIEQEAQVFEVGVQGLAPLAAPPASSDAWPVSESIGESVGEPTNDSSAGRDTISGPKLPALEIRTWPTPELPARPYPVLLPYLHPQLLAGRDQEISRLQRMLAMPLPILGLHAASGVGKSSLLLGGLVPMLRERGRPVAIERHPREAGQYRRLLTDLVTGLESDGRQIGDTDLDWRFFVAALHEVEKLSGDPPVLILDQFEQILQQDAEQSRVVLGSLMAATVRRRPGIDRPFCYWLLAYRQEYHGQVTAWLSDVLRDARQVEAQEFEAQGLEALPHDLSRADRFHALALAPLATPHRGVQSLPEVTAVFRNIIEQPLSLTTEDGKPLFPWHFPSPDAERLATAFASSRLAWPEAPLAPELQVVLAHLMAQADEDGTIEVAEDPSALIGRALEDHLRRALDDIIAASSRGAATPVRRARALLVLRQLAARSSAAVEDSPQRNADRSRTQPAVRVGQGLSAAELTRAFGEDGEALLQHLARPDTRVVVARQETDGELRYCLAHDGMAEVIVSLVHEQKRDLLVDPGLLSARHLVAVKSALFANGESGAVALPRKDFKRINAHQEALIWTESQDRWWQASCRQNQTDQRRFWWRSALALGLVVLVSWGISYWASQHAKRQALVENLLQSEPEMALAAFIELDAQDRWTDQQLLALLRQRDAPMDVLERGLGAIEPGARDAWVLRLVELALPWVDEAPEDPMLLANLVRALDSGPIRRAESRSAARQLRQRALAPMRSRKPPPPLPAANDPDWIQLPAGTFTMGFGSPEHPIYRPHPVQMLAFRMSRHELTNRQYRRLKPDFSGSDDRPAMGLNWYEAYTYAAWLGGRLPTEAEWEYAARAGCAYDYCRRDGSEASLEEVAWTSLNRVDAVNSSGPMPVMSLEPNPLGFFDMHGNAWEWTADFFAPYPETLQIDPQGATQGSGRVLRGGSFRQEPAHAQATSRYDGPPYLSFEGFRVMLDNRLPSTSQP